MKIRDRLTGAALILLALIVVAIFAGCSTRPAPWLDQPMKPLEGGDR